MPKANWVQRVHIIITFFLRVQKKIEGLSPGKKSQRPSTRKIILKRPRQWNKNLFRFFLQPKSVMVDPWTFCIFHLDVHLVLFTLWFSISMPTNCEDVQSDFQLVCPSIVKIYTWMYVICPYLWDLSVILPHWGWNFINHWEIMALRRYLAESVFGEFRT